MLLAKLSLGDMIALEAKYHTICLLALYNHARKVKAEIHVAAGGDDFEISGIVFAELLMYLEEVHLEAGTAPVLKLADLAQLYPSRMKQLGVMSDQRKAKATCPFSRFTGSK